MMPAGLLTRPGEHDASEHNAKLFSLTAENDLQENAKSGVFARTSSLTRRQLIVYHSQPRPLQETAETCSPDAWQHRPVNCHAIQLLIHPSIHPKSNGHASRSAAGPEKTSLAPATAAMGVAAEPARSRHADHQPAQPYPEGRQPHQGRGPRRGVISLGKAIA
ncbi:hypothetical protein FN846DRAFT_964917 [Sphaerosporella brunnea]|uniref:Uncharacterized protein n=1 Tax=Sphaerosporella brunnea TaxID=1250544 RepID=A0A5J5EMZ0_9PEZI|nr:hypothetical protein FN846DRAFT_964917 [Sphaerosporella brunnea]